MTDAPFHYPMLAVTLLYKHWWHRLIPSKRREAQITKQLVEDLVNQEKFLKQVINRYNQVYLYGDTRAIPTLDNYEGISIVGIKKPVGVRKK